MNLGGSKKDRGVFPSAGLETVYGCVLVGPSRARRTMEPNLWVR